MPALAAFITAVLLLSAIQEPSLKSDAVDFSKIDRTIKKQPAYLAKPQYALLLLGEGGKVRIWMALDRSQADGGDHNVLYLDRDGDGQLGEEGERIVGEADRHGRLIMKTDKLEFPQAGIQLEDFQVYSYPKEAPPMTFVSFKMNGKVKVYGGYGQGGKYLQFGESLEKAPILHVDPWGKLSFFHAGPNEMSIGQSTTVMLYVGTAGAGPAAFTAVDESFLDLEKDKLFVTLIAKDAEGKELRERAQLKDHC